MEQLVETFFQIDRDFKGFIRVEDLEYFVEHNDLDESMTQAWFKLFDPEKTGSISLHQFCDRLGLVADDIQTKLVHRKYSKLVGPSNKLGPDVDIKFAHMREELQIDLVGKVRQLRQTTSNNVELVTELKTYLDSKYGPIWHTGVISGSYWISHAHIPEYSLHFQIDDINVIAWKTSSVSKWYT